MGKEGAILKAIVCALFAAVFQPSLAIAEGPNVYFPIHDAFGKEDKGYTLLKPDSCVTLESESVKRLPGQWQKYREFVKRCALGHGNSKTNPFVVSIWILDYYDAKFPTSLPHEWEDFPRPLIMDRDFKPIGELPEHYPDDPPRELEILYSKKNSTTPPDIKAQVYNPAVSGNYAYPLM